MRSILTIGVIVIGLLNAQQISYVSCVKPNNDAGARGLSEYSPGGCLTATAVTVRTLIRTAYRIQDYQLVGAPGWFADKRYDIAAKVDDNPPPSVQVFLRTLLKDRFGLTVHSETRETPTFALVMARSDGKLGPQLNRADFDCAASFASPHPLPEAGRIAHCSARINMGALSGKSIPISQLTTSLAAFVNRFTVDKTGLTGGYDVELTWAPEQRSMS